MIITDQRLFFMEDLKTERFLKEIKEKDERQAMQEVNDIELATLNRKKIEQAISKDQENAELTKQARLKTSEEYQQYLKTALRII